MKTDGIFEISKRQDVKEAIAKELDLTKKEVKQLECIWNEIEDVVQNPANIQSEKKGEKNVIKVFKDCWQKIVDKVNAILNRSEKIEVEGAIEREPKLENIPKIEEEKTESDLEGWFLDDELKVDRTEENGEVGYVKTNNIDKSEKVKSWYEEYKEKNGEMNFPAAMDYLKENPELDSEIAEYIKKCFGICDGDVSTNKQGLIGTCHLLACQDELYEHSDENKVVVQNDDGTVSVTFNVTPDLQEEPVNMSFIIKNKEIADSYKLQGLRNETTSSDPDAAALELGYKKLIEHIDNIRKEYLDNKDILRNKVEQEKLLSILNYVANNQEDYADLFDYLTPNYIELKELDESERYNKLEQDNMWDLYLECLNKAEKEKAMTPDYYTYLKEFNQNYEKYKPYTSIMSRFQIKNRDKNYGDTASSTWRILTGKSTEILTEKEKIDKYLETDDYKTSAIVVNFREDNTELNLLTKHAYSFKDVYEENGVKFVKIRNPHGNMVTLKYNDFITNVVEFNILE